ncbi:TPA: diacylglycerol kinase [Candidatus Acetothermia bacterium]|nr:diacylglycerol kinase [Candidatus Acetothermia bacterium]
MGEFPRAGVAAMSRGEALVILNPAADRGRAGLREPELRLALDSAGLAYELVRTQGPGHASHLARTAVEEAGLIIAAGGDGTVNEVAQGLVGSQVPLGVLPVGSGNDYARALGLPKDLTAAARHIAQASPKGVDVGWVGGRYFLNSMGMGIDGQIALDYRRMRLLRGELGYLWATCLEILRFRAFQAEIEGEGWRFSGKLLSTAVMNGPYAGGGFYLAPRARPDDGLLDVVVVGDYPRVVRFSVLPKTRDGSYLALRRVQLKHGTSLTIRADRPVPVHMDGELLPEPTCELSVKLFPGALLVCA